MTTVSELCYGLRFVERDGKKILQTKLLPISLTRDLALTPNGKPGVWVDVVLENEDE